ncbi:MAG: ATP-binding protein [Myxococcota bacterium]
MKGSQRIWWPLLIAVAGAAATFYVLENSFLDEQEQRALEQADTAWALAHEHLSNLGPLSLREDVLYAGSHRLNGDESVVDHVKEASGFGCTIFRGNVRVATTARAAGQRRRALGTQANELVTAQVLEEGREFRGITTTIGKDWVIIYRPLATPDGERIGMLATYVELDTFLTGLRGFRLRLGGGLFLLLVILVGLTLYVRARTRLFAEEQEREQRSRLRAQLFANLSHELRTPLVSILTHVPLIETSSVRSKQELQNIHEEARELLGMINNILDFAKLEHGEMPVSIENVEVARVVSKTVRRCVHYVGERNVEVEASVDEALTFPTDSVKLQQILTNLVSNALKFTESGTVRIMSAIENGKLCVIVSDTGPGIAQRDLRTLFEPFRQADETIARRHGGTGLGLSIVHALVTLLDGTIRVESSEGEGTTFRVLLPPGAVSEPE